MTEPADTEAMEAAFNSWVVRHAQRLAGTGLRDEQDQKHLRAAFEAGALLARQGQREAVIEEYINAVVDWASNRHSGDIDIPSLIQAIRALGARKEQS